MLLNYRKSLARLISERLLYLCIVGGATAAGGGIAMANDATAGSGDAAIAPAGLEEIVVTANRREENLSKVPISVSAYTQEAMDLRGIKDFSDIVRFTPGVTIDAGQTNSISIRGISSSGGAGTTGIYIDDTPIQIRALGFNPDDTLPKTFDLDRVEVLRGPQGTLFGAGSEGGTVRYIMTQPSLTKFSSYSRSELSYTQGGTANYEAGIAAGGPIIEDVLGVRASAWFRRDGGYIDRIDPTTLSVVDRNANHDSTTVLRVAAAWAPIQGVLVTPSVLWQNRDRNDVSNYWPLYSDPSSDRYVSANPTPRSEPDRYLLPSLKISADLGKTQLISNTSYYKRDDLSGYDGTLYNLSYYQTLGWAAGAGGNAVGSGFNVADGGALPGPPCGGACYPLLDGSGIHLPAALADYRSPATVHNKQENITQELRLQSNDPASRVTWTVGAFFSINRTYSLEEIHDPQADTIFQDLYGVNIADAFGTAVNPDGSSVLPNGDSYLNQLIGHDRQIAGFGEAVWSITDRLKATTGIRYSKTDFTFNAYNDGPQNGGPAYSAGEQHQRPKTWRLGLSWQQDPDNLYYATYSTGFRIGGANSRIPPDLCAIDFANFGITDAPSSYKSDTVRNYELGAKNNFNNRIKIASSVYYIKWSDIQQSVYLPTCALTYNDNLGRAVSEGADIQADFAVTDALTIETAVGYGDAHYTQDSFAAPDSSMPIVSKGNSIVGQSGVPPAPWTITVGAEYKFRAFEHASFARVDYELETHNSRPMADEDPRTVQYGSCTNNSGGIQPCYYTPSATTFVSVRAGTSFDSGFSVSGFIDNLLDTHTITNYNYQGVDGSGPQPAPTPLYRNLGFRPRTFGLTFTYRQ